MSIISPPTKGQPVCMQIFYLNEIEQFNVEPAVHVQNVTELVLSDAVNLITIKSSDNNVTIHTDRFKGRVSRQDMVIIIKPLQPDDCNDYMVTSKAGPDIKYINMELICPSHTITILSVIIGIMGFLLLIMIIILLWKQRKRKLRKRDKLDVRWNRICTTTH